MSFTCTVILSSTSCWQAQVEDGPDDDGNMFTRPGKVREQQNMNSLLIGTLFAGHFESFHRHTLHSFKLINIQRLHGYTYMCMRGSNKLVKIFKLPVACRFLLGKILFYHIQYNYTYTSLHQKRVVQYSYKFMHGIVYCCYIHLTTD